MRSDRRWRAVALLATGIVIGTAMIGTPAGAHVAGWAHNWTKHIRPLADKRYLPANGNALVPGKTVRGTWATSGVGLTTGEFASAEVSFGWRFPAPPAVHIIRSGETPPADCPGTLADPRAKPGHLCVWESSSRGNAGVLVAFDWTTNSYGVANRQGTVILGRPAVNNTFFYMAGTWAATAGPKKPAAALARPACPQGVQPAC